MDADDAINIAKDSLDLVSNVFELGSAVSDVSQIFKISGQLASAFPVVGAILMLVGNFLPDGKHEEILSRFRGLSTKIDRVRDDIKDLGNVIKWELTELNYKAVVNDIETGMKYSVDIGRATGQNRTEVARKRLKDHCSGNACIRNLNYLLDGMTGNGLFTSSSIVEKFDATTANCYRKRISSFATRLLQVASGGILVIATYETMMHGVEEAKHFIELHEYANQLKNSARKAQSVGLLDRCVYNFRQNMLNDLNTFLDTGRANAVLVTEINTFMADRYDWLENFVLVYDDMLGSDKHWIGGDRVNSLHRNGKCGIVYYRIKSEFPRFSDRYDEAYWIAHSIYTFNAQWGYNSIQAKIAEKGIGIIGCAVIGHEIDYGFWTGSKQRPNHLSWAGYFSTKIVIYVGQLRMAENLRDLAKGVTIFLFLQ